jgi:hypothetical protein
MEYENTQLLKREYQTTMEHRPPTTPTNNLSKKTEEFSLPTNNPKEFSLPTNNGSCCQLELFEYHLCRG